MSIFARFKSFINKIAKSWSFYVQNLEYWFEIIVTVLEFLLTALSSNQLLKPLISLCSSCQHQFIAIKNFYQLSFILLSSILIEIYQVIMLVCKEQFEGLFRVINCFTWSSTHLNGGNDKAIFIDSEGLVIHEIGL